MPYRLVATDIDGTLLDHNHEVTPRARRAVRELQRRGIPLVLTTARPSRSIHALHQELELTDPFIAYNGALVYDPHRDETLLHRTIPLPIATRLLACVRAVDASLTVGLEMPHGWYLDRIDPHLQERIDAGIVEMLPTVCDLEGVLAASMQGANKVYFVAPDAVRVVLEERFMQEALHLEICITSSAAGWVEISAADVNKGTAVRALAERWGLSMESTLALGDGENDIPALQMAGLGIAMGHAAPSVREAADVVTGSYREEGWAEAIERYVLG